MKNFEITITDIDAYQAIRAMKASMEELEKLKHSAMFYSRAAYSQLSAEYVALQDAYFRLKASFDAGCNIHEKTKEEEGTKSNEPYIVIDLTQEIDQLSKIGISQENIQSLLYYVKDHPAACIDNVIRIGCDMIKETLTPDLIEKARNTIKVVFKKLHPDYFYHSDDVEVFFKLNNLYKELKILRASRIADPNIYYLIDQMKGNVEEPPIFFQNMAISLSKNRTNKTNADVRDVVNKIYRIIKEEKK